jgi:hypothetical protein
MYDPSTKCYFSQVVHPKKAPTLVPQIWSWDGQFQACYYGQYFCFFATIEISLNFLEHNFKLCIVTTLTLGSWLNVKYKGPWGQKCV